MSGEPPARVKRTRRRSTVEKKRSPDGHRTGYLWEQVWARDSWLEILGRHLVNERNEKKQITTVIFPRYHQFDATRIGAILALLVRVQNAVRPTRG